MDHDRRATLRLPFRTEAVCRIEAESQEEGNIAVYGGAIRDLSIEGLFIVSPDRPAQSTRCKLTITLEAEHSSLALKNIEGEVSRINSDGFVVNFDHRLEWFALVPIYFRQLKEEAAG